MAQNLAQVNKSLVLVTKVSALIIKKGLVTHEEIEAAFQEVAVSEGQESGIRPTSSGSDADSGGDVKLGVPAVSSDSGNRPSETGSVGAGGSPQASKESCGTPTP